MVSKYRNEPNVMEYLFRPSCAIYKAWEIMREGVKSQGLNSRKIDRNLIQKAKREVYEMMIEVDRPTHVIAEDIANFYLGRDDTKNLVLIVQGTLIGGPGYNMIFGMDLGTNHNDVFRGRGLNGTIDELVTRVKTEDYLRNLSYSIEGIKGMLVDSSKFFYFRSGDLLDFRAEDGTIDMHRLLPLVIGIGEDVTHIGIEPYKRPGNDLEMADLKQKYDQQSPLFASYRLKRTLKRKVQKLLVKESIDQDDCITDFTAHRLEGSSEDSVRNFANELMNIPKNKDRGEKNLGCSEIKSVTLKKDYYNSPKDCGDPKDAGKPEQQYKALHLVANMITTVYDSIREIQLVDKPQYFINEVKPDSPVRHTRHKKKETIKDSTKKSLPSNYNQAIEEIFATTPLTITINE